MSQDHGSVGSKPILPVVSPADREPSSTRYFVVGNPSPEVLAAEIEAADAAIRAGKTRAFCFYDGHHLENRLESLRHACQHASGRGVVMYEPGQLAADITACLSALALATKDVDATTPASDGEAPATELKA